MGDPFSYLHPHVLRIFAVGISEDAFFLKMMRLQTRYLASWPFQYSAVSFNVVR